MNAKITGKKIQSLRKARGWTQNDLAEKLFVSDKTISRWESGLGYPEITQLPQIAELFDVSVDYLLSEETKSKQENIQSSNETNKNKKLLKTVSYNKIIFTILLTLSVLMFFLFLIDVDSKSVDYINISYNYKFSYIRLFNLTGYYIVASTMFAVGIIYSFVNCIVSFTFSKENQKKYSLVFKINSLIANTLITIATLAVLLKLEITLTAIAFGIALFMLLLSIYNFFTKEKEIILKDLLINYSNLIPTIAFLTYIIISFIYIETYGVIIYGVLGLLVLLNAIFAIISIRKLRFNKLVIVLSSITIVLFSLVLIILFIDFDTNFYLHLEEYVFLISIILTIICNVFIILRRLEIKKSQK